jgi:hypothetical protein
MRNGAIAIFLAFVEDIDFVSHSLNALDARAFDRLRVLRHVKVRDGGWYYLGFLRERRWKSGSCRVRRMFVEANKKVALVCHLAERERNERDANSRPLWDLNLILDGAI